MKAVKWWESLTKELQNKYIKLYPMKESFLKSWTNLRIATIHDRHMMLKDIT